MEEKKKIQSFTDLIAWQEGHKLAVLIYRKTELFPKYEIFGLTSQIRRAAVSVTSNIAEGFNRTSLKEKVNFYAIAQGSVGELESQLLIARDIDFLELKDFTLLADKAVVTHKLLIGLIQSTKNRISAGEGTAPKG
ncbi:MAG: four helix bundle protein [Candidatus Moraniibacteriota bacterium]